MNRMKCVLLAVILGCLIGPAIGKASPVYYTAVGSVMDEQGRLLPIVGGMHIDDQLRDKQTGQPTNWHSEGGSYIYQIDNYSLHVGANSFSGDDGILWLMVAPSDDDWFKLDFVWFLENGQGAWTKWIGEDFFFYDADSTQQNIAEYGNLAKVINLVELAWLDYPIIADSPNFSLWLIQKSGAAPVPEPSTIALLASGTIGIFLQRRRNSRRSVTKL